MVVNVRKFVRWVAIGSILSSSLQTPVNAQNAPKVSNHELYEQMYAEMIDWLTGAGRLDSSKTKLQFVPEFIDASWHELEPLTNLDVRAHAQSIRCITLPLKGEVYSAADYNLFKEYEKFLRSIKMPTGPGAKSEAVIEAKRAAWEAAQEAVSTKSASVDQGYTAYVTNMVTAKQTPLPYQGYLVQSGQGKVLGAVEQKAINAATAYYQSLGSLSGSYSLLGEALVGMSDKANKPTSPMVGGTYISTPVASINPQMVPWLAAVTAQADGINGVTPSGTILKIKRSHRQETVTTRTVSGGGGGGLSGFFSGRASGSSSQTNEVKITDDYDVTLSFKATNRFECSRQPWFDGGFLNLFTKKADFISGPNALIKDPVNYFFGPDGTLKLIPTGFLVAVRPKLSVTLSATDYKRVKEQWNASGSFRVGFFGLRGGASGSGSSDDQIWNDSLNQINIELPTNRPVIVAVYSATHMAETAK